MVRGYWWGLGIGRLVWDCDYAAVALGFARGGVWLQVSCSTGLRHSLPLVDFGAGAGVSGSLCLSPAGGLLEHPTCGPLHCRA